MKHIWLKLMMLTALLLALCAAEALASALTDQELINMNRNTVQQDQQMIDRNAGKADLSIPTDGVVADGDVVPLDGSGAERITVVQGGDVSLPGAEAADGGDTIAVPDLKVEGVPVDEQFFPDQAFRAFIAANFDDGDHVLTQEEIQEVDWIDVSGKGIANLTGVEVFYELEALDCSNNALTALNVSANRHLEELNCSGNKIVALDFSFNGDLEFLRCADMGALTKLNVAACKDLELLNCAGTGLTALDVSACKALASLDAHDCASLASLTLPGSQNLVRLDAAGTALKKLDLAGCTALVSAVKGGKPAAEGKAAAFGKKQTFDFSDERVTAWPLLTPAATVLTNGKDKLFQLKLDYVIVKRDGKECGRKKPTEKNSILRLGQTLQLEAVCDLPVGKVTWKSSNENVATVSSKGVVKGLQKGKSYITATTDSGLTVKHGFPVKTVKTGITARDKTYKVETSTKKYTCTLKDSWHNVPVAKAALTLKVNGKIYTAKTSSKGVATFKLNKLTKKGTYSATITFASANGYVKSSKKVTITVI